MYFPVEFDVIELIVVVFEEFKHSNRVNHDDLFHNDLESIQVDETRAQRIVDLFINMSQILGTSLKATAFCWFM